MIQIYETKLEELNDVGEKGIYELHNVDKPQRNVENMFWNLFRKSCSDEKGSAVEHLDCQRFTKMVDAGPSISKIFEQQPAKWAENS